MVFKSVKVKSNFKSLFKIKWSCFKKLFSLNDYHLIKKNIKLMINSQLIKISKLSSSGLDKLIKFRIKKINERK